MAFPVQRDAPGWSIWNSAFYTQVPSWPLSKLQINADSSWLFSYAYNKYILGTQPGIYIRSYDSTEDMCGEGHGEVAFRWRGAKDQLILSQDINNDS